MVGYFSKNPGPFGSFVTHDSPGRLSYHINILKEQDFIAGEQQGNRNIYSATIRGRQALKCTERL